MQTYSGQYPLLFIKYYHVSKHECCITGIIQDMNNEYLIVNQNNDNEIIKISLKKLISIGTIKIKPCQNSKKKPSTVLT